MASGTPGFPPLGPNRKVPIQPKRPWPGRLGHFVVMDTRRRCASLKGVDFVSLL